MRALSSLLGVGGGKEAVLEGPILLGRLVFAMELARLREHTLNARRRGRAAKELACHLGKMDFYAILPNGFLCQNGNFSWRARFLGWPG